MRQFFRACIKEQKSVLDSILQSIKLYKRLLGTVKLISLAQTLPFAGCFSAVLAGFQAWMMLCA
jgi:hypothetical protein